jgi:hypothetical protein
MKKYIFFTLLITLITISCSKKLVESDNNKSDLTKEEVVKSNSNRKNEKIHQATEPAVEAYLPSESETAKSNHWTYVAPPIPIDCIKQENIKANPNCGKTIEYVCGCNNISYDNPCLAKAAGVKSYKQGKCGS